MVKHGFALGVTMLFEHQQVMRVNAPMGSATVVWNLGLIEQPHKELPGNT